MEVVPEERLRSLTFRIITPDERVLPVSELCSDPVRNVLRLEKDNHAYVLVQAVKPSGEVYWTQGFYMSSGRNSLMRGTWFPMDGILKYPDGTGFVNKLPYLKDEPPPRQLFIPGMPFRPPPPRASIINKAGLLEGDTTLDRVGPISMQMASNQLGHYSNCDFLSGPRVQPDVLTALIRKYRATAIDRFRASPVRIEFPTTDKYEDHEAVFMGLTYTLAPLEQSGGKRHRRKTRRRIHLKRRRSYHIRR